MKPRSGFATTVCPLRSGLNLSAPCGIGGNDTSFRPGVSASARRASRTPESKPRICSTNHHSDLQHSGMFVVGDAARTIDVVVVIVIRASSPRICSHPLCV